MPLPTTVAAILVPVATFADPVPVTSAFPYLISSALIPGSGQYLLDHKVKGPIVLALEAIILSSGVNDGFYLTGKWGDQVDRLRATGQGPFATHDLYFLGAFRSRDSMLISDSLNSYRGELEYSKAIRDRTLAWAAGFHIYNILDCYHYVNFRRGLDDSPKSGKGALLRSLALPGWGQWYNREFSKLGMFVMAAAGFGANVYVWNRVAGFYGTLEAENNNPYFEGQRKIQAIDALLSGPRDSRTTYHQALIDTTLAASAADSLLALDNQLRREMIPLESEQGALKKDNATLSAKASQYNREKKRYLSFRNQNIWYLFALYMYSSFDAYVDAHLHDFEPRLKLTLSPQEAGLRANLVLNLL